MTYDEAIDFWFRRINYEQKTPKPSDLSLERIRALLDRLDRPQERYRIVHVAGSKGKGSTAAMLAAILQAAGFRVGLFTSPHLVSVTERIQVNGAAISEAEIAQAMADIAAASRKPLGPEALDRTLTFFEVGTALGFLHFARRRVDVAVVEVGLGGRFDSTNVCTPLASVITSISFDHTRQLGNTLALIAREKAGIIKPGRPVISGVRAVEADAVIVEISRQRSAPLKRLDADFSYRYVPARIGGAEERCPQVEVKTARHAWPAMRLELVGEHQAANAAVAVATIETLREQGLVISDQAVAIGLAEVRWPARLECLGKEPLVLLDCAHNVASAEALVQAIWASYPLPPGGRRILVFAGSRDKDLPGMLAVLARKFDHIILTRFAGSQRSTPPEELKANLADAGNANVETLEPAVEAWRRARELASAGDLICITGSVFLAGELRPLLTARLSGPLSPAAGERDRVRGRQVL